MRRYARTPLIDSGRQYGTSAAIPAIRDNINKGNIRVTEMQLQEGQRLDTLAGLFYGDGRLWWVIAAASGIGNGLQVPPGTRILVPDIEDVDVVVG